MAANMLSTIEKLKGRDNYPTWKFAMENYLLCAELDKCILGTEKDTGKDAKARAHLVLSIDPIN